MKREIEDLVKTFAMEKVNNEKKLNVKDSEIM